VSFLISFIGLLIVVAQLRHKHKSLKEKEKGVKTTFRGGDYDREFNYLYPRHTTNIG
jgi:hypothetical protein